MTESKPQYLLEFVLGYDKDRVIFTASTDNPFLAWQASQEISTTLNNGMVSDRVRNNTEVTVNLYKDGKPLDQRVLLEEVRNYYHPNKKQD